MEKAKELIITVTILIITIALFPTMVEAIHNINYGSTTTTDIVYYEVTLDQNGTLQKVDFDFADCHDAEESNTVNYYLYQIASSTETIEEVTIFGITRQGLIYDLNSYSANASDIVAAYIHLPNGRTFADTSWFITAEVSSLYEVPHIIIEDMPLSDYNYSYYDTTIGASTTITASSYHSWNVVFDATGISWIKNMVFADSGHLHVILRNSNEVANIEPTGLEIYYTEGEQILEEHAGSLYLGFLETVTTPVTLDIASSTLLSLLPLIFICGVVIWFLKESLTGA